MEGLESFLGVTNHIPSRMSLERAAIAGDSPVGERGRLPVMFLSTTGHGESCGKPV